MTSDLHIFLPPLIINKLNQNVSVGREQSMILILQVRDMDVLVGSQTCFAQLTTVTHRMYFPVIFASVINRR